MVDTDLQGLIQSAEKDEKSLKKCHSKISYTDYLRENNLFANLGQRPPSNHTDEIRVKARALLHLCLQSIHELSLFLSLLDPQRTLINDILVGEKTTQPPHVAILVGNWMIVFGDDLETRAAIEVREL